MIIFKNDIDVLLKENKDRESHYWFGGEVATATSDLIQGTTIVLGAFGDVRAYLIDKATGDQLVYVKDKGNNASFYYEMKGYIKDDAELDQLLEETHEKYILEIDNNNWWEAYAYCDEGHYYELGDILDATTLSEAIEEVKSLEKNFIELVKKES